MEVRFQEQNNMIWKGTPLQLCISVHTCGTTHVISALGCCAMTGLNQTKTKTVRSISSLPHLNWTFPSSPLCQYLQPNRTGINPLFLRLHFSQIREPTRLVIQPCSN